MMKAGRRVGKADSIILQKDKEAHDRVLMNKECLLQMGQD